MIAGLMLVKDEIDVIGYTLPRFAAQVDFVTVLDNRSSDGTRELLDAMARDLSNVEVLDDPEVAYVQSEKLTRLAHLAKERGATWAISCDADEWWTCPAGRLADVLPTVPEAAAIVEAVLYDHVATGLDDPDDLNVTSRIGWRRSEPLPLPKVACRILPGLVIDQGNHNAHYPGPVKTYDNALTVHHYPYRSAEQMIRKVRNGAAAYRAAEGRTPSGAGQHWISYDRLTDEQLREVFETWFYSADPENDPGLVYEPAPV